MRAIDGDALIEKLGIAKDCNDCEHNEEPYCRWKPDVVDICEAINDAPTIEPEQRWIPCTPDTMPDDLEEVNITFTNLAPEPYYDFIKGKCFTGSAVFYKGEWYWYSSITVDVLKEYGRYESEKIDEGIKIVAWMPLPEPYKPPTRSQYRRMQEQKGEQE